MCMSCRGSNKKRIAIIAGAGAGVAGIAYALLAAYPVAAAALPVVLVFAACPAMCAAMAGIMWLNRRMSKRKNLTQMEPVINSKQEVAAAETKSIEGEQQIAYPQKRRKDKADAQDTSAIND
jgi:uncharacterized membrane protein YciS (DUF1049 family)